MRDNRRSAARVFHDSVNQTTHSLGHPPLLTHPLCNTLLMTHPSNTVKPRFRDRLLNKVSLSRASSPQPILSAQPPPTSPPSPSPLPPRSQARLSATNKLERTRHRGWSACKEALKLLGEASDAFGPLKSAVGGLVGVLDRIDVRVSTYAGRRVMLTIRARELVTSTKTSLRS
jgi:hypothetical protein